jgi:hypothetical protein
MKKAMMFATACAILAHPAFASPLTYTTVGVAGTIMYETSSDQNANVNTVTAWANYLLGMDANAQETNGTVTYKTSNQNFDGTLSDGSRDDKGGTNVAGFEWVLAKYDGKNAGYVLFHMPTYGGTSIPKYPYDFWTTQTDKWALSNFTGYGSVPDGGTTLMLLGGALVGLEGLRRRFRG